jgi:hypothetical protein
MQMMRKMRMRIDNRFSNLSIRLPPDHFYGKNARPFAAAILAVNGIPAQQPQRFIAVGGGFAEKIPGYCAHPRLMAMCDAKPHF